MLLRRHPPTLDSQPITTVGQYAHVDRKAVAVLRWLQCNHIQYVLVGPIAEAIRGSGRPGEGDPVKDDRALRLGPVSIVPAPFGRNFEKLSQALWRAHARLRIDGEIGTVPVKMNEERLMRSQRWTLRCGEHDIDIEGRGDDDPQFQELLFEAGRFELAPDLSVEVASPEDLAHYAHLQRTGTAPEIRIARTSHEHKPV